MILPPPSFIFKILKELAETQQDLEITRSSNMTILTLLLEKKICSKEEYVSTAVGGDLLVSEGVQAPSDKLRSSYLVMSK